MSISNVTLRSLAVSALNPPCYNHLLILSPISYLTYARHVCNFLHMVLNLANVSTNRFSYASADWIDDIQQIQAMGV